MTPRYEQSPHRMRLDEVIAGLDVRALRGDDAVGIGQVTDDSRALGPDDLFVAVRGRTVDGHRFLAQAAEAGAVAVIVEQEVNYPGTVVRVDDSAVALGLAAANRLGHPGRHLGLVGITGTNGKTTTTYLLEAMLAAAGQAPGVVGTVSYRFGGQSRKAPFTTPTAPALQGLLAEMALGGTSHAVLEVSSHALELGRVAGLDFDVAAFTNFTQDHLDLHGSMEAYAAAKRLLFVNHLGSRGVAVLWADDPAAAQMVDGWAGRVVRVSRQDAGAEVLATLHSSTLDGLTLTLRLHGRELAVTTPLVGEHNLNNLALAAGIAAELGLTDEAIVAGAAELARVPGRLERVLPTADVTVLVDYAHTPDALAHALDTLRPICRGRLFGVFGCGGDRDALKRPLMGRTVAERADLAVVTSDNPRSEDPLVIIDQILGGVTPLGGRRREAADLAAATGGYCVQPDRRAAIGAAIGAARPGDVVLIAGKGHEDYQILGDETIHFDDCEEAIDALERRGTS